MAASDLNAYIAKAREKNLTDKQIKDSLIAAGWPTETVEQAFHVPTVDTSLLPPPPPPVAQVGMWTGFLYIIFFICLYICTSAIGIIFHSAVDRFFPPASDPYAYTDFYWFYSEPIQGALAAIIVSFPLFAFLAFILKRQLVKNPAIRNLRSRKIWIYITLVGTFLIMIGHIIGTVYSFINGMTDTMNLLGHLTVTILLAGSIFTYFISEVKHDSNA